MKQKALARAKPGLRNSERAEPKQGPVGGRGSRLEVSKEAKEWKKKVKVSELWGRWTDQTVGL